MDKEEKDRPSIQVTDRRFWVRDESVLERAEVPERRYPTYVEQLKARTEAAEQKLQEKLQRLEEENEAFRVRFRKEMERRLQQQKQEWIADLLEVLDNLERALEAAERSADVEALKEGVRLNLDLFLSKLRAAGMEPLELLHQEFDPRLAEAIGMVQVSDPALDHKVVEVIQRGYRLGDQLLRPALVRVGRFAGSPQPDEAPVEGGSAS